MKYKCPYCNSTKEYVPKKGEMGTIHSHGQNKIGSFGTTGKRCGNNKCEKFYEIFTQFFSKNILDDPRGETYIKYNIKYKCGKNGTREISFKRKDIK